MTASTGQQQGTFEIHLRYKCRDLWDTSKGPLRYTWLQRRRAEVSKSCHYQSTFPSMDVIASAPLKCILELKSHLHKHGSLPIQIFADWGRRLQQINSTTEVQMITQFWAGGTSVCSIPVLTLPSRICALHRLGMHFRFLCCLASKSRLHIYYFHHFYLTQFHKRLQCLYLPLAAFLPLLELPILP